MGKIERWRSSLCAAVAATLLLQLSCCSAQQDPNYSFMKEATSAPDRSYYDYIIIGGGTAGCPLAATLSQNANVLLLERGGSPYGDPNITYFANFGRPFVDTSPSSPSQRFVSEDGVVNARARVLGGGSCINAGFYTRAGSAYVQHVGWDGRLVQESFDWVEKVVAFEPQVQEWQSAVRGGLLETGVRPYNGFTYNHLLGTKVGGSIFDRQGQRHTAADLLRNSNPSRITVLLHSTVHKVLFRTKGKSRPIAHGVIFRDASGAAHRAYLNKGTKNEIIISAGALGSPQLLMLSGVGPADHLRAHNITVVLDQPNVGQSMSDNPMNAIFVPSPTPVEVSLIQVVGITDFGSFIEAASGQNFLSSAGGSSSNSAVSSPEIGQLSAAPPAQSTQPQPAVRGGFILEKIMGPISTGHLELVTRNPNDNPSVTFNYFKEPKDLQRCVEGIRTIQQVIDSNSFSRFRYPNVTSQMLLSMTYNRSTTLRPKHNTSSITLEQFCVDTVMTIWHYHGGCQVDKVVDHDYRVLGVDALRVIDGSTFNYSPGTNPQATVMMLGRYMGVKILSERLGK